MLTINAVGSARRHEIEEMWRDKLHAAERRYRLAAANYQRLEKQNRKRPAAGSDSILALQQALHMENVARAEYLRVLQTFTALVLYGQLPEEEARSA